MTAFTNLIHFFTILLLSSGTLNLLEARGVINRKIDLSRNEWKGFSQNGEDGVLNKIFSVIGTTNRYFVEFGVEEGSECNTRYLREFCNWQGLMMDGFHQKPEINLFQEFITAENINFLFFKYGVPLEFDLLSIDIDYNDFYVWAALQNYSPRVVVIEYNASHLPNEDKVVVYNPFYLWDLTNYYGASICSLNKLANLKGYTLVYAERRGVNLFFIRNDIAQNFNFKDAGNVHKLYKPAQYGFGPNGGHVQDPLFRSYFNFFEAYHLIDQIFCVR